MAKTIKTFLNEADLSEEEYGAGVDLPFTGFLIFGILTCWIYNVWVFHRTIMRHMRLRMSYFNKRMKDVEIPEGSFKVIEKIKEKGFKKTFSVKYLCIALNLLSMLFLLLVLADLGLGVNVHLISTSSSIGVASFCFSLSTIIFLLWTLNTLRSHEYYEILLSRHLISPEGIKLVLPSKAYVKCWGRNYHWVTFFIIINIPMTASLVLGVKYYQKILGNGVLFEQYSPTIYWLVALVFATVSLLHIMGVNVLIRMFNGHLRTEMANREIFSSNNQSLYQGRETNIEKKKLEFPSINAQSDPTSKRDLTAIMFTDMAGFSKDMEKSEENTCLRLQAHNSIIREKLAIHNGKEIRTIGDAFLVCFSSAVDAVKCGISIQDNFTEFNRDKQLDKIIVRIGIHIGDILIIEEDVFGNSVNIAARIEPLAEPGGICISSDVYNVVKKSMSINVIHLGKIEMKNIKDVPDLYKVMLDDCE